MHYCTFIDCSRLEKRTHAASITGIDRVIQSYAHWLTNRVAPCHFIRHSRTEITLVNQETRFIPSSSERSLTQTLTDAWRQYPKYRNSKKLLKRITEEKPSLEELDYSDLNDIVKNAYSNRYKCDPKLTKNFSEQNCVYFSICHTVLTNKSYLDYLARFKKLRKIFFLHDLIPLDFPEHCRDLEDARHKLRVIHLFEYADHIIVNSQYTYDRLIFWQEKLDLPSKPITIIHIGVHLAHSNCARFIQDRPYFVVLGTIEPRKNHQLLLDIWEHFSQTLPPEDIPQLKIIGKRGWKIEELIKQLDENTNIQPHIQEYNDMPDDEVWPILKGANALLFPSHVEGWGMPLVEALAMKIPAICSDIPALREAGQNIPAYIHNNDTAKWAETILNYAQIGSTTQNAQIDKLSHFVLPTWEKHFTTVEDIINSLK